jgi:diguanylate cyclase (GGDEF)-like protein
VPLRRLARRAIAISRGELDLPPLPEVGPSGLRALTATMNDMLSTFDRVNSRIQGLAAGDLDAPVSDDELPGAIGESLRNSVRHLATVTQLLQRSEALSSAIITQADDAIWTLDDHGTIRSANTASSRLTGLLPEDQVGRPIAHVVSQTTGEATILTRPGQAPKVLVARSVIDVGDERITAVIAHDISERARYEERLTYQALHDALTGLPNRFAVLEHLEQLAIEHPGEVAALYIDLDGFKSVNDVQGHAVGDRVLAEVAQRLTRAVGNGEFIGRLGGDEFVVVTHRFAQQADVVALGHRLVREVETPHEHDGQFLALSACVGITIPSPGTAALDILGQADSAVYQAKRQGRGRVELFDEEMQQRLQQETELELELRNAVRNGELVVYLQPVIDLRTNQFCGAEALVRWIRPGHGMVPPGDFIPLAERSSLIMEIERWVLARACERLVEWRRFERGCTRRIAVNISGRHLIDGDLLADVDAVLNITGADPNMLELELTETQLLEDMDRATRVLDELRRRGIRIAVDDFGTGYSSMTYLRELPIDAIKIDRSFVSRATEHGYDSTVIQALLTIGTTLDLTVVAEGVETAEQLRYLQARGCDMAQGYLLARPMPIEDAEALIFAPVPAVVRPRNPFESVPTQRSDVSESLPA